MTLNPYQSPKRHDIDRIQPATRHSAVRAFRVTFVVLLAPALLNYYAFDTEAVRAVASPALRIAYRTTNLFGFVVGSFLLWFVAFPSLEFLARKARSFVAPNVESETWDTALYASIRPAIYLAVPGAVIWALWVFGFYFLRLDFVAISLVAGILAHLLAACVYVPLIGRWYRLSRNQSQA